MKNINWKALIISLAIPLLLISGLNSFLLMGVAAPLYTSLILPPLAAPAWIFPPVWTILYALMGLASYYVWMSVSDFRNNALKCYVIQLALNFAWPLIFFRLEYLPFSALVIVALLFAIGATIQSFDRVNKTASKMLIPYFVWVAYATYLNVAIALIN